MTDQQINAAIAKACGWEDVAPLKENPNVWIGKHGGYYQNLEEYCDDLNAMHEAEEVLLWDNGPGVWECYRNKLRGKYGEDDIHTTARQRAEAFLKTLGKWEEA